MRNKLKKLPLWKNCVDRMINEDIAYGKIYQSSYFEEHLMSGRITIEYQMAVANIRRYLERMGFYLSGRGFDGESFVILDAKDNSKIMEKYQREARQSLARAIVLGSNTDVSHLTAEQQQKHDAILSKAATKLALIERAKSMGKFLEDSPRKLKEL